MADDDKPTGVETGRQMFTDRRMPTRTEVAGSNVARGRALRSARGDRKATHDLLTQDGTDVDGGGAA